MEKKIFINYLVAFLIVCGQVDYSYGQKVDDFRGLTWGMTYKEVQEKETAPLTDEVPPSPYIQFSRYELHYKNVKIANQHCDIYYSFENGKLEEARIVFRTSSYFINDSIESVIKYHYPVIGALHSKNFKYRESLACYGKGGREIDYGNKENIALSVMKNSEITQEKLAIISRLVKKEKYEEVGFRMENERTRAQMFFTTEYSKLRQHFTAVLILKPSFNVLKELDKSGF